MKRAITMAAVCASLCAAHAYTHPGVPLTNSDLAALKAKVDAGEQLWKASTNPNLNQSAWKAHSRTHRNEPRA